LSRLVELVTDRKSRIWCFTDAGKVGEKCAEILFAEVGTKRFCKWVRPENGQPSEYGEEQIRRFLAWNV